MHPPRVALLYPITGAALIVKSTYDKVSDRSEISRRGLANPEADGAREIVERPEPWWRYVNGLRTLRTSVVKCRLPSNSDVSTIYPIYATRARDYENESVRTYGSILATLRDANESLPSLPFISQWGEVRYERGLRASGATHCKQYRGHLRSEGLCTSVHGDCQTRYHLPSPSNSGLRRESNSDHSRHSRPVHALLGNG